MYRAVLAQQPKHDGALHMLGLLAHQIGRASDAVDLIRQAIAARPDSFVYHVNLGAVLSAQGRLDEAIVALNQAVALQPNEAQGHYQLGLTLMSARRFEQAIEALQRSVAINPNSAEAQFNLGAALGAVSKWEAAIAALRAAIALKGDLPGARQTLASALVFGWRPGEAAQIFREEIAQQGETAPLRTRLGNALFDAGEVDQALAELRRAMDLAPQDATIHSIYLFMLQYHPDLDAATILREHRLFDQRHAQPLRPPRRSPHQLDLDPDRRLRIGYTSADFREHAAGRYIVQLFEHHDRSERGFEITCYAQVPVPDKLTDRLRNHVDRWRDTVEMSDEKLAHTIREDRIDVLVDLSMHMAKGRLLVYAREPAPVQLCWLAYPGTTGLSAMQYRLSDPYLDPPGSEVGRYSEETILLPHTFWCYDPMTEEPVGPLPAESRGHITFGCLNNFCKVSRPTVTLWAKVLKAVPGSRMIMMAPPGPSRQRVLEQLSAEGISGDRVEFVPFQSRQEYLKTYQGIDICLDTIPYNGHTTSLDAFWMGVPVITRIGHALVGRAGLCQLSNLGLPELAANSDEAFVMLVSSLANDRERLAELRRTLRERMRSSPLHDGARFARDVEAAYREAWQRRISSLTS